MVTFFPGALTVTPLPNAVMLTLWPRPSTVMPLSIVNSPKLPSVWALISPPSASG
jgi:hypothetical protein